MSDPISLYLHQYLVLPLFQKNFSHSDRCVKIFYCGFNLFPWWLMMLDIFLCTYWPSIYPVQWTMSPQVFCPFSNWIFLNAEFWELLLVLCQEYFTKSPSLSFASSSSEQGFFPPEQKFFILMKFNFASQCGHLFIAFFHTVWNLPGSWHDKWFFIAIRTLLC